MEYIYFYQKKQHKTTPQKNAIPSWYKWKHEVPKTSIEIFYFFFKNREKIVKFKFEQRKTAIFFINKLQLWLAQKWW